MLAVDLIGALEAVVSTLIKGLLTCMTNHALAGDQVLPWEVGNSCFVCVAISTSTL